MRRTRPLVDKCGVSLWKSQRQPAISHDKLTNASVIGAITGAAHGVEAEGIAMASTQDLNSTELATLLNNVLDPTDAANIETWAANHLRDGLTPVETIDTAPPYPGHGCSTLST
jgi:hypothetical protein